MLTGPPSEPHPVLGQLATELHSRGWPAELVCSPGRSPCVLVHGGAPGSICEKVFATENGGLYIPGLRPHLAPKGNVTTAADRLIWILRARALHEYPAEIRLAIDDLTALQRALARLGQPGEVIIPEPYLLLPPGQDGTASVIRCHLLEFHWAGLPIGRIRHTPLPRRSSHGPCTPNQQSLLERHRPPPQTHLMPGERLDPAVDGGRVDAGSVRRPGGAV